MYMGDDNLLLLDLISNELKVHPNVLHAAVEDWVLTQVCCTYVVEKCFW